MRLAALCRPQYASQDVGGKLGEAASPRVLFALRRFLVNESRPVAEKEGREKEKERY